MTAPRPRSRQSKQLDAGIFQAEINSFTPGELSRLERACAGRSFAQRRDTAIIAVLTATGIRLSELAGLRCEDVDLWQRELTVRGKGGKDRIVKLGQPEPVTASRSPPPGSTR